MPDRAQYLHLCFATVKQKGLKGPNTIDARRPGLSRIDCGTCAGRVFYWTQPDVPSGIVVSQRSWLQENVIRRNEGGLEGGVSEDT